MKHFKLRTDLSIEYNGKILYRIEATEDSLYAKKGDLGGYIESEDNLLDNAWVSNNAWISGSARVSGSAWVYGNAWVSDNAWISGSARVSGSAWISESAWVYGSAHVSGSARVSGNAHISKNARVSGSAWVYGNAHVSGSAWVYGNAHVSGSAIVETEKHCINIINLKHNITITKNHIQIGCELHTIEHWEKEIKNIGKKHNYSDAEIKGNTLLIKGALLQRGDLE